MIQTKYYKRSRFILIFFSILYLIIIGNLYRIQIKNNSFFMELGQKQYQVTTTINPPRAAIYDRSGKKLLAMNNDSIAAFILPKKLTSPETLMPFLQQFFPQAYERFDESKNNNFMYIARRLNPEQLTLIEQSNVPDIQLLNEPSRFYPTASAGQIVGITDIDNKGIFGLEMFANNKLAGKPTTYSLERDARSGRYYFKRHTQVEGKMGEPLTLTIDADLQFLVTEELKKTMDNFHAKEGAVIVMNPTTGEIVAMTSLPSFDPNNTKNINLENTKNRIVTEEYELGSAIKIFATLAALEEGVVTIDELIDCENVKTAYVDGRKINTVPSSVAGIISFSQVIEKSNNIGIAKVVKRLGNRLYDHYLRMGFGKKTGIEFPGERSGFVNPPHLWSKQSLISLSYGYEITATILQLAVGFCIIANDGYAIKPTLIRDDTSPLTTSAVPLYSASAIATTQQILENTVLKGTAKKARIQGYTIRCKTGTANLLVNGQYSPTTNIFTCVGYLQKGDYKRVIATFIKEVPLKNVYASTIATPLFERVAEKIVIHEKIM